MSTVIRTELSKKHPYWISKHRMLELKHFCLQYRDWETEYREICVLRGHQNEFAGGGQETDRTGELATEAVELDKKMRLVEDCCREAGDDIWEWLLKGVTEGLSFTWMEANGIPCGRDYYYIRYRRFFWLLDKRR